VPRSRDLAAAASWIAVVAVLALAPVGPLELLAGTALGHVPAMASPTTGGLVPASLEVLVRLVAPPLVACFAAVLVASLLFTGPVMSWHAISPRLERLSPLPGLRRMLSGERWLTLLRDAAKLALLFVLASAAMRSALGPALACAGLEPRLAASVTRSLALDLAVVLGAAAAVFALVDVVVSRHSWLSRQRMTLTEMRRELRETEGDPSLRGQRRRLHREIAEHRMIEEVRRASFVIVNPTRYAVALRWREAEMDAPTVTATGRDELARRIVREARRAGVPVMHDPGLARSLAGLAPGEMIPEELYEAVAAILRALGPDEP
jgi:flagellar biosynthesis protein FlhB